MSEQIQLSAEDLATMQKMKVNMDSVVSRIGQIELQKSRMITVFNEFKTASDKFIAEVISKYGLPKDKRIEIDEKGFVSYAGDEPVKSEPN